jgi:hypothetical protein
MKTKTVVITYPDGSSDTFVEVQYYIDRETHVQFRGREQDGDAQYEAGDFRVNWRHVRKIASRDTP